MNRLHDAPSHHTDPDDDEPPPTGGGAHARASHAARWLVLGAYAAGLAGDDEALEWISAGAFDVACHVAGLDATDVRIELLAELDREDHGRAAGARQRFLAPPEARHVTRWDAVLADRLVGLVSTRALAEGLRLDRRGLARAMRPAA